MIVPTRRASARIWGCRPRMGPVQEQPLRRRTRGTTQRRGRRGRAAIRTGGVSVDLDGENFALTEPRSVVEVPTAQCQMTTAWAGDGAADDQPRRPSSREFDDGGSDPRIPTRRRSERLLRRLPRGRARHRTERRHSEGRAPDRSGRGSNQAGRMHSMRRGALRDRRPSGSRVSTRCARSRY